MRVKKMMSHGSRCSSAESLDSVSSIFRGGGIDLVASLSDEARRPLDEVNRKWHTAGLFICACLSLVWGIRDILDDFPGSKELGAARIAAAALTLVVGIVVAFMRDSARCSEIVVTLGVVVWSTMLMWGFVVIPMEDMPVLSKSLALLIMEIYVLFASLPAWSCGLFLTTHTINSAALFTWAGIKVGYTEWLVCFVSVVCLAVYVYYRQEGYRAIRHILEAEQEASKALVSMFCDAAFWIGPDGDTIVRGDRRLDMIMLTTMDGQQLSESFEEEERMRFAAAIKQSPILPTYSSKDRSSPSFNSVRTVSPAKLLHTTLQRWDGSEIRASLLIVAAGSNLGFMIGLRLDDSMEASAIAHVPRASLSGVQAPRPTSMESMASALSRRDTHMSNDLSFSVHATSTQPLTTPQTSEITTRSRDQSTRGVYYSDWGDGGRSPVGAYPPTLASSKAKHIEVLGVGRLEFQVALHRLATSRMISAANDFGDTLRASIDLLCNGCEGGALVLIAPEGNFKRVFANLEAPVSPIGRRSRPMLRTCDGGYMTKRLKGLHVGDERFVEAFADFARHTHSDRWPDSHRDPDARSKPKDGALLLDVSGFRLACAVKLVGLVAPASWPSVGTRHETALACASTVEGCVALVRSDSGRIHGIVSSGAGKLPRVYNLLTEDCEDEEISFVPPLVSEAGTDDVVKLSV